MSEDKKRRCVIKDRDLLIKGFFVKYGKAERYDDASNPYTIDVAIVECDDGKVMTVNPNLIIFKPDS